LSNFWDAGLSSHLQDVTLHAELAAILGPACFEIVKQFGFAIVDSSACVLSDEAIATRRVALAEFGAALGQPMVQSPRNELVEDVKDYSDIDAFDDRGYRSRGELKPHSDPPTLILLHCIQPAKEGGESSLVNVGSIVERMGPGADELFAPLPDWWVAGQYGNPHAAVSQVNRPVLARHNGTLSCVLYRPYVDKGAEALGVPLTNAQRAALDLFESMSLSDELTLRFVLQPGQTLVLHNRAVLHARTDYIDWPEFDRRRHLQRMWIDAPTAFPVHPAHELGDFFGVKG
jgi:hypothetical protein